ncbi:MAG: 30S ribosomal protein S4 [Candidatus Margulisbacteria bacterium]|nr:30S ribosomal protein S4 [Candidatus Margulisiibacteriota bacterium]
MGRYTGPACKLCRREGEKLFLKGEKCATEKCAFSRRSYAPGQHGKVRIKVSEYRIRLREKQKARRIYGLTESQFERYFDLASSAKGATGEKLLEILERRLDNVIYRLGFALSRRAARQMIHNGGVLFNGRKMDIPSHQVKVGDVCSVKPKIVKLVKGSVEKSADKVVPSWLAVSGEAEGKVVAMPKREDIDSILSELLIVEYYSR